MSNCEVLYYLKEQVYFEPLFNHWYAWPYLIPPVTAARHMTNTHRRIMSSFINDHELHILGNNEPGMAGAEFMSCSNSQLDDIKNLIDEIDLVHVDIVELSDAVRDLDNLLRAHTSGQSLEGLYSLIPKPLKGYVELVFDMNHNPSFRLIESLLYRSKYYRDSLQSVSFGSLERIEERPFVLSTPRLPDENHLQLKLNFCSDDLNRILMSREIPMTKSEVDNIFNVNHCSGGLDYLELFTSDAPSLRHEPARNGIRLSYLGHAGFLVETSDTSILIDPFIASRGRLYGEEIISFSQLPPKIDFICLTHNHQDHVSIETLLQLRYKTKTVLVPKNNGGTLPDPSIKMMLVKLGFTVIEVDDLEEVQLKAGKILAVPFLGEHGDLNVRSKTAWFVEIMGKRLFFGADSSNLDPEMYVHIHDVIGDVDVLALGMECVGAPYTWLYGALYTKLVPKKIKDSRRLNGADFEQAAHMVETFNPKKVFIYALGMEPWYKYFMGLDYDESSRQIIESKKLTDMCNNLSIPVVQCFGKEVLEL